MKINQQTVAVTGVIVILGLLFAREPIKNWESHDVYDSYFIKEETPLMRINDEINVVKKKLDSLTHKKEDFINDDYSFDGGLTFWKNGTGKLKKKGMYFSDTTAYLQLGGIGLDLNEEIGNSFLLYYEKNGQGYLSRTKFLGNYKETTEIYDNGKLITREGNTVVFKDKKVDYKYSYRNKSMLVPLKSKFAEITAPLIVYLFGFLQLGLVIIIARLFFKFLMFVARNNAFEEENIDRLKYISAGLFILAVNKWIIYGIVYLAFISAYSNDGVIINYSFWDYDYQLMISAILCYLIYNAFKRGMVLQKEQELTI